MFSSKDDFLELREFEKVFGKANEFLSDMLGTDRMEAETEEFEIVKGNYRTTLVIKFNKSGYPISSYYRSKYEPSELEAKLNTLKAELSEALRNKNYLKCHEINEKIESIKNQQKTNKNK